MSKNKKLIPELRFPEFANSAEWEKTTLNEVADFRRGSFPQPYGLPEWYDDVNGMPFIQVFDVADDFRLKPKTKNKISELATEQSVFIPKGTVIITIQGSIGRVAITQYDAYIDRTLLLFEKFHREIDETFFAHVLFQLFEIEKQKAPGGIIKTITKEVLSDFIIQLPTIKEQQKIASCLSSLDEVITAHSQKLELLKNHKKGLMQKLFPQENEKVPKLRFKEFKGEWGEKMLGEVCLNIASGKDKNEDNGEYNLYGSTGIIGKTNSVSYDGDFILVARVGANAGFLNRVNSKFGVTDNTLVISLANSQSVDFIYYTLENFGLNKLIFGSGQPLITGGQLKNLELTFPTTIEEQQKIASCLSTLDELITAQAEKIEQLKQHKKGLMQVLFPKMND